MVGIYQHKDILRRYISCYQSIKQFLKKSALIIQYKEKALFFKAVTDKVINLIHFL